MSWRWLLSIALLASPVVAEPIDNCASVLGSLSVELRVARRLPTDKRTTFVCPRDTSALLGASKQRIVNSLGPPDVSAGPSGESESADGNAVAMSWSYFFSGAPAGERGPGTPELRFDFNASQLVSAVHCQRTR